MEASGTIEELREAGHLSAIIATEEAEHVDETALVPEITEADVEVPASDAAAPASAVPKKEARKLVKDEEKAVGNVQWKTYKVCRILGSSQNPVFIRLTTFCAGVAL